MWTWVYLAALAIGVAAIVVAAVRVTRHALATWRYLRTTQTAIYESLDRLADAADRVAERMERTSPDETLAPALTRLRRSNAQLAVLRAALAEVQDSVAAVTGWYPRK